MDEPRYTLTQFPDVETALRSEEISVPSDIDTARAGIWILPTRRWESLLFEEDAVEAMKVAAELGIRACMLTSDPRPKFVIQKSADIVLPALLVFLQGAQQVPWAMLANYLSALVGLHPRGTRVRSKLYLQDETSVFGFEYEGPASELVPTLREARKTRDA